MSTRMAYWAVLAVALGAVAMAAEPGYEIGPGDVLQVFVLGQQGISGDFTVGPDGIMAYPFIGRVKAAGVSPAELERKLTTLLGDGYLKHPQISVAVKQYKSQRVFVTGEVPRPGPYGLRPDRKLSSLLQDVGDLGTNIGHEVVVIRAPEPSPSPTVTEDGWDRGASPSPETTPSVAPPPHEGPMLPGEVEGAQVFHVNLRELRSGYPDRDIELQVGDTVYFPKAAHVYVTGFVARPGILVYEEGLTVYQALNLAGGITERGSEKGARIVRLVDGKKKTLHPKLSDVVQPEDTVQIPERFF